VLLLVAMTAFPLLYAIFISFHKWKTTYPARPNVGTRNFERLLVDDRFINAIEKTLLIGGGALLIECVLGLGLALLFWHLIHRARWIVSIVLLPMMVAPVVVGFTARMAFTDSFGFVNQILSLLLPGEVSPQWLSDPGLAPFVIIVADVWQWTPFVFLILLAGLLSVPEDLLEAARVDGAGPWQLFRFITLPAMKYILIVAVVLRGLDAIKMFDVVQLATRGGPGVGTETITVYIYNLAFKFFDLGYGAAAGLLMLVGVSVLVGLAVRTITRGAPA
jgi:multiple sugar transport system permease protein